MGTVTQREGHHMTAIYRIEIEVDGDPYAETNWDNYAIDAMFEAFGTRKLEQLQKPGGVDLTLDNSTYEASIRMTGPHDEKGVTS